MIVYFKDKNHKSKKKIKNYKILNTNLESVDTIIFMGATSTSITLSLTGVGFFILPIAAGIACTQSLGNKVLQKIIINNYKKYEKNMININKQLNLSRNYTETLYEKM